MADVTLTSVQVTRVLENVDGFWVEEILTTREGKTYPRRWTVWAEGVNVSENQEVSVRGKLTVKQREYVNAEGETKTALDYSVNDALVKVVTSTPAVDDSTPF